MQRVSAPRVIDGCEVFRAAYFNGRGDGSRCYIARRGEYTAHGDSVAAAVRDVPFKELQENFDSDQLVKKIKSCGIVTFTEYPLLTGACGSGLRAGINPLLEFYSFQFKWILLSLRSRRISIHASENSAASSDDLHETC
ncbi:hypothetical protein V6x_51760 [Gimesia chilikensis]|uniref:Uncharacterized protein n=1 Tax=Gimesia chilikensis TaxID=2605989 RepID=A0A517WJL7_9PLAN|nr:hypothetical protein [Gimesia chilikensis]QDU05439.1 hypothetical protein V6x_51760 [Gimesia chilikensis]